MALIVGGKVYETPFPSRNWRDAASLRLAPEDRGRRARRGEVWSPVQIITIHNTGNLLGPILPGTGPNSSREENTVSYWTTKKAGASAHMILDYDGVWAQCADLWSEITWHATTLNPRSIGLEIVQRASSPNLGGMYEIQLQRVVEFCNWFMRLPPEISVVQPQYPAETGMVERIHAGGVDFYGVCGHCHQTTEKKRDPGPAVFAALKAANYKAWNVAEGEDRQQWTRRQTALGVKADGLPGENTRRALMVAGYPDGLAWGSSW